jgi:hypothetical protein
VTWVGGDYYRDINGSCKEEDFGSAVLFKASAMVGSARKGVRVIAGPGLVKDLKVIPSEKRGPSCLSAVEGLGLDKVNKIFMVTEYVYLVVGSFEVMMPGFERSENG